MIAKDRRIMDEYRFARERFAKHGVDVLEALKVLDAIPISIQCWQGDDVLGFERGNGGLTGGIQATGNYIGRARNAQELRADLQTAMAVIPGRKRINLHAIYLEATKQIERDQIEPSHFRRWIEWAKQQGVGLDFNPTCFSHPKSAQNLTLSHPDPEIRKFWIKHCLASRRISEHIGLALKNPCIMNIWVPDGLKDLPADRLGPRKRLLDSLDEILRGFDGVHHKVSVEGKLFGIGAESYTVGSNEFYLGYAATRNILLCLDAGHFHPTESIADKVSATLCFIEEILLHISRPVRWDSDHVVLLDDETLAIARELVRCSVLNRVHIGMDFFDASINRVAAWVIGARNVRKALLCALLEPRTQIIDAERKFEFTRRMALMEEAKSMPWAAVWDFYCASQNVPVGPQWLAEVLAYEKKYLRFRN